jgi:hypothetical protein
MEEVLKQITNLFAMHGVTIKFDAADKYVELIRKYITHANPMDVAKDKMNIKYVPPHLYRPIKMTLYVIVLGCMLEENDLEMDPMDLIKMRIDSMVKIITNQWHEFSALFKQLYDLCSTIEGFTSHYELIDDKDLCIKIVSMDTLNFFINLNAITTIIRGIEEPEPIKSQTIKFTTTLSKIIKPEYRHMLNDVISTQEFIQVCDFFIDTFLQHYKIRSSDAEYAELHALLTTTRPLELIEAEANMYMSLVSGMES